jgi:hypothetical protein
MGACPFSFSCAGDSPPRLRFLGACRESPSACAAARAAGDEGGPSSGLQTGPLPLEAGFFFGGPEEAAAAAGELRLRVGLASDDRLEVRTLGGVEGAAAASPSSRALKRLLLEMLCACAALEPPFLREDALAAAGAVAATFCLTTGSAVAGEAAAAFCCASASEM